MATLFPIEIDTPERRFFEGQVESVILDTPDGKIGIMAGHRQITSTLDVGEISMLQDGEWKHAFCSAGFFIVLDGKLTIMAQTVEWPEEIDVRRAKEALERAEEALRQKQSIREYMLSKASMARAMARLRVTNQHNVNN
ncbi:MULTISPECIES: ATP synthase F1 subunit epsilon [unclassified Clostridium]|jgi:F-type H+-transporting ATPase subunit epsilon|uniref:ATP synthase F1 subunit epsilon n=1 Tax=Clostridia TaxID=186801 RepID=UPI001106EB34|nr:MULTISPECIES: ATP synthase F1 subunit epsilon [unclassified Clostridium]